MNRYHAYGGKFGGEVLGPKLLRHENTLQNTEEEVLLPRINFNAYSKVTFTISGKADWDTQAGIVSGQYAFPYGYKVGVYSGELTFIRNGSQLNVTFACDEGITQNITINDSNILRGLESETIYMRSDNLYRGVHVELTSLVA